MFHRTAMAIVRQLTSATTFTLLSDDGGSSETSFTLLPGDRAPSRTGSVRVTDAFRFLFPWTQQSTAKYRKRFTSEKPVLDLVFTVGGTYIHTAQSVEKQFFLVHGFAKEIILYKSQTTVVVNTFCLG
jgi:hypothetical protein